MLNENNGGPAFPTPVQHNDWREDYPGMTLRDYFAAKAMQGLLSTYDGQLLDNIQLAEESYKLADAMLEARK